VFDRKKGDDYQKQFVGEFRIGSFDKKNLEIIRLLKK